MDNQKQSTIYDVAAAANVSVATVSRVINHYEQVKRSTSEKVLNAMTKLSFDIEQARDASNKKRHSKPLALRKETAELFIISIPKLTNNFYTELIEGAQAAAKKHGHHILINNTTINSLNSDFYISLLKTHNIAGMILTESMSTTALTKVKNIFPVVQCSEYNEEFDNLSYVGIDDTNATYEMTQYFISTGYRKIAYLTTPLKHQYAVRRKRGFTKALSEAGLVMNSDWIIEIDNMDFEKAVVQIQQLLNTYPPEAIIAVSDTFAAAAIKAAERSGLRVPEDIAIMGMDDTATALSATPTISTVFQPRYQLGYTAFELLLTETFHPHLPKQKILLNTHLIFRESTRAL